MPGNKIGFFWGNNNFSVVETAANNVPARTAVTSSPSGMGGIGSVIGDVEITGLIQKTLRAERINGNEVRFSIPSEDTIIRSFLIPWMKTNEAAAAIEFEAKKYIPFPLKDLSYAYHSIPVTENKIKKLRVIFVAVRRVFLDRYARILEQGGLNIVFSEPAPLSLLRAMQFKKFITQEEKVALLQIDGNNCRILFIQDGVLFFIREFQLMVGMEAPVEPAEGGGAAGPSEDLPLIKTRLLNEIHNSMEFYARQYPEQPIGKLLVLSSHPEGVHAKWLQEDMTLPVKAVDPTDVARANSPQDQMGVINAFGASIANDFKCKATFNLSRKTVKHATMVMGHSISDFQEYVGAAKLAASCALLLVGVYILTQVGLSGLAGSFKDLDGKQSNIAQLSAEDLKGKLSKNAESMSKYKSLELKNSITPAIVYSSSLLPEGAWIKSFNIKKVPGVSKESGVPAPAQWVIEISGYVYSPNANQEIRSVNEYVTKLKGDKRLAKYFSQVNLSRLQREEMQKNTVIYFMITCS